MLADGLFELKIAAPISAVSAQMYVPEAPKKISIKVKFTPEEDAQLAQLVQIHGSKDWTHIAQLMGTRNARQCRERYKNYVNPELRKDAWTPEEDKLIEEKFNELGPKWNKISKYFNNRSDNALRNRWMMIARHRTKTSTSPSHRTPVTSPVSPPAPLQRELLPTPMIATAPKYVIPAVKEISTPEKRVFEPPFECLINDLQSEFPAFDSFAGINSAEDMWATDLGFF